VAVVRRVFRRSGDPAPLASAGVTDG
jgi:hypothetical protein